MIKRKLKSPSVQKGNKIKAPEATPNDVPPQSKKPIFSFQHLQAEYCISHCTKEQKLVFVDKLRILGQLSWGQIWNVNRHKLGCEKIATDAINVGLPAFIKEDVTLLAFRFAGMAPMIGYREDNIFHIVWLDRNFKVYNHG